MNEQNERLKRALKTIIRNEAEEVFHYESIFFLLSYMTGYNHKDTAQLCEDLDIDVEITVKQFLEEAK